jgi:hypothetical protein
MVVTASSSTPAGRRQRLQPRRRPLPLLVYTTVSYIPLLSPLSMTMTWQLYLSGYLVSHLEEFGIGSIYLMVIGC